MDARSTTLITANNRPLGTAFITSPRTLMTCLHVVRRESELGVQTVTKNGSLSSQVFRVRIAAEIPNLDIAILELEKSSDPLGGPCLPLAPFPQADGHCFTTSGFPNVVGCGLTELHGRIRMNRSICVGSQLSAMIPELEEKNLHAFQLDPTNQLLAPDGMSGAAIYAPFLGGVVAVFGGYYPDTVIYYAIPITNILQQLPRDLTDSLHIELLPHLKNTGIARTYNAKTFCLTLDPKPWEDAMQTSDTSIVSLLGPSGIGKSSHASYWANEARAEGHMVIWADIRKDLGFGEQGNLSIFDYLFNALAPCNSDKPEIAENKFFSQLNCALNEYEAMTGKQRPRFVVVADGIEALETRERQIAKERLITELMDLNKEGIPGTVIFCERSEFTEAQPSYVPKQGRVRVHNEVMAPLSRDDTIRVYEDGYRKTDYPWLPAPEDLPHDLLELCRIPVFITFLIKATVDVERGKKIDAGVLLREVINGSVEDALKQLSISPGGAVLASSLRDATRKCLTAICRRAGLATPPLRMVKVQQLIPELTAIFSDYGLNSNVAEPHTILSALSRVGIIDFRDGAVSIASDVLYEFMLCEVYVEILSDSSEVNEPIEDRLGEIFSAIHNRSIENVTKTVLNELVERLLSLEPCRETSAMRFWSRIVVTRSDWPVLEMGMQLRLLQTVTHYCTSESKEDRESDERLYKEAMSGMPGLIPESVLAFPPIVSSKRNGGKSISIGFIDGTERYNFSNTEAWIKMRRALFLLLVISEHTVTVLQNIARFIGPYDLTTSSTERLVRLAKAIIEKHPRRVQEAYVSDPEAIIHLLVRLQINLTYRQENGELVSEHPRWLKTTVEKLLPSILAGIKADRNKASLGSLLFIASSLQIMPEGAVDIIADTLKHELRDVRSYCLHLCSHVVGLREQLLSEEEVLQLAEANIPWRVFNKWAPLLRNELEIHAKRPSTSAEDCNLSKNIAEKLWDGTQHSDFLPDDSELRPRSIEVTIKMAIQVERRSLEEVISGLSKQIRESSESIEAALDAIVLCLAVTSQYPSEWLIAWNEVNDLILAIDEIKEMSGVLGVITQKEETRPGERYEAINLLLLPFDDETRYGLEVKRQAVLVERWAKGRARFPGEKEIQTTFNQAHDLLRRKDFTAAQEVTRSVIKSKPGPLMTARCYLLLVHAARGIGDDEAVLAAINNLECYLKDAENEPLELLVKEEALGSKVHKLVEAQRVQLHATLWPAREIRAEILSKRGDDEDIAEALANLISNRIEALGLGAWWQAWRALVRECDLNRDLGQPEVGIKSAKQFEDASPKHGPKLMGKMQRAVMMYYDGVQKDDSTEIRDAIGLLEEVYPSLGALENIIPKHEIEGIEIWLTSIQAWCLDYLGEHEDAIKVARQVLDLTCRIKSDREISRALGQLARCLEKAGNLSEAFENTRSRFNLCKRKGGEFAEEAAEAARSAGRILSKINKSSPTTETDSLSEHWYNQAMEIYKTLGKIALVEEIDKEMSSR